MQPIRQPTFFALLVLLAGVAPSIALARAPSFSAEQAAAGRAAYLKHCASCHGQRLEGEHLAPPLRGARFDAAWRGKSAAVLAFHLRRMPPEPEATPGSLGDETYTNILAFLLQFNGAAAGEESLPSDLAAVGELHIPRREGVRSDPDAPVMAAGESELLKALPAVTEEMVRTPAAEDWVHTGGTYRHETFSPLNEIDRENIGELAVAWRAPLRDGSSMPMPIVLRGVMFLHTFPDTTLALDAASGKILWRYRHVSESGSSQKMGLALQGEKVLVPTSDLHVLALRAKTGELIWDHAIAVPTPAMRRAYNLRSAPLVAGDKVIQGVTASFVREGGFAVALDVDSGEEVWRFHSIARPGEPGGDSWNGVPLEKRSGGSIWHQASYDPELDLVYFGIAPTYDTGPLLHPVEKEGTTSNALYTNCTVALRPKTGELAWYYQHVPNDQWDLDWAFERQIVELPIDGATRKVVMTIGKMGILEALDAKTGAYLFSVDPGIQNVITSIDPETGAKTIDPAKWPDPTRPADICPSAYGARSWPPTSYDPRTKLLFVPLTESCMRMGPEGVRLLTSGVGISSAVHPDSSDGKVGRLTAIDVAHRKLAWTRDLETPLSTGALATAGGLVFVGDTEPSLKALDDSSGELLWRAALDDAPSSSVISYSAGDRQYVAIVLGMNNYHIAALENRLAPLGTDSDGADEGAPGGGAAIWAFALK